MISAISWLFLPRKPRDRRTHRGWTSRPEWAAQGDPEGGPRDTCSLLRGDQRQVAPVILRPQHGWHGPAAGISGRAPRTARERPRRPCSQNPVDWALTEDILQPADLRKKAGLHVEAELHDGAVLHDVVLAFQAHPAAGLGLGHRAGLH